MSEYSDSAKLDGADSIFERFEYRVIGLSEEPGNNLELRGAKMVMERKMPGLLYRANQLL